MTRKDFVLIARVIRNSSEVIDEMALEALAENFANELSGTNPNFNRDRFLSACLGVSVKDLSLTSN